MRRIHRTSFVLAIVLETVAPATAQSLAEGPMLVCERAARQAEHDWGLPKGLLAAIGLVESGRRAPAGKFPMIWPWTINAEGQGYYLPSEDAAVGTVRALQRRGVRAIDVGCFQVDLFYHPYAFASLEEAFEPDANARAAARILSLGRLGSTGWDGAIAAYHSVTPLFGAIYLQKVRAIWPWTVAHPGWGEPEPAEAYAVLLSPQARLVKVVTPLDAVGQRATELPRAKWAGSSRGLTGAEGAVQWLNQPVPNLPRVLTRGDVGRRSWPTLGATQSEGRP